MDCTIRHVKSNSKDNKSGISLYDISTELMGSNASLGNFVAEGSTVGKYKMLETLGNGENGKVMLAKHEFTGKEVAVKIIDKTNLSVSHVEILFREVRIMEKLHHPNIVKLFEIIETENTLYLVMEYVNGCDLNDYCELRGTLDEKEARAIFRQVLSAVEYCHYNKVIHRDLKKENILIDNNLNIKIIDFGLSNEFTADDKLESFCGTPKFMAPELFLGKKYGSKIDVWSLGVILHMMLTGQCPFYGDTLEQVEKSVLHCKYKIPDNLSRDCGKLLKKLIVFNPKKRYNLSSIIEDKWVTEGYEMSELRPHEDTRKSATGKKIINTFSFAHFWYILFGFRRYDVKKSSKS